MCPICSALIPTNYSYSPKKTEKEVANLFQVKKAQLLIFHVIFLPFTIYFLLSLHVCLLAKLYGWIPYQLSAHFIQETLFYFLQCVLPVYLMVGGLSKENIKRLSLFDQDFLSLVGPMQTLTALATCLVHGMVRSKIMTCHRIHNPRNI